MTRAFSRLLMAAGLLTAGYCTSSAPAQVTFPNLIHHWSAEGNALDTAGAANGTPNGAVGYVPGKFGQAFDLDPGEFLTFGTTTANFGTSDFTISVWFRTDAPNTMAVVTKRPVCMVSNMFDVRVLNQDDIQLELCGTGGAGYTAFLAGVNIHDGQWHHLAYVRSGTALESHVDGCLTATDTTPTVINFTNTSQFTLGKSPCTNSGLDSTVSYDGQIDEVQVYNRALTSAELDALAAPHSCCPADLNHDGVVDGADLGLMLGAWGTSDPADINGDTTVDGADLGLLLGAWGDCS
jgi:hypothetical protein